MNTIKLPAEFQSEINAPVEGATITRQRMAQILDEAIEADRQKNNALIRHMPEIIAALKATGCNESLVADIEKSMREECSRQARGEPVDIRQEVIETLEMILAADWRKWEELASPDEFVRWAKSRANYALTIINEAPQPAEPTDKDSLSVAAPVACFKCGHTKHDGECVNVAPQSAEPVLDKYQPCGCVICTCEDDVQCQGCGARHCGRHPIGELSDPVYVSAEPSRSEPVAMIRHFHYQGIARSGLAQEAVMLDGAPTLPDGAMLYTAPQPQQTPEGYKLVPIEPTIEQTFFGVAEWNISEDPEEEVQRIYKSMIEAAPEPTTEKL